MYKDMRIRTSIRSTPVPRNYRAFVFRYMALDTYVYKVILAPDFSVAFQRLKDFSVEQGLDAYWSSVTDDDFEIVFYNNIISK